MKSYVDDPRLTAYALGEVDETDRAEVESMLQRSPDARRWVEDVRTTAAQLRNELRDDASIALKDEQRAEIEEQTIRAPGAGAGLEHQMASGNNGSPIYRAPKRRRVLRLVPLALAASVAVAAGLTYVALNQLSVKNDSPLVQSKIEPAVPTDPDVGSAVRTDPILSIDTPLSPSFANASANATTSDGVAVVFNIDADGDGYADSSFPESSTFTEIELLNLVSNVDLDGVEQFSQLARINTPHISIDAGSDVTFSDGVTARVIDSSAVAMNRPQVYGAVETLDYNPSDQIIAGARFTSGGYDYVNHQALRAGTQSTDGPPQIGLTPKPSTDLRYSSNHKEATNSLLAEERKQISQSIQELQTELAELDQYRKIYNSPVPVATVEDRQWVEQDAEVAELLSAKWQLEENRAHAELKFGAEQPEIKDLDRTIAAIDDKLSATQAGKQLAQQDDVKKAMDVAYASTERALQLAEGRLKRTEDALNASGAVFDRADNVNEQFAENSPPIDGQTPVLLGRGFSRTGTTPSVDPLATDPNHATYAIKGAGNGQYACITARDQAHMLRSVADVEDRGDDAYYFSGGMVPQANSQNRDNEHLAADLNYVAVTNTSTTVTNIESIELRDISTASTDLVLSRMGSLTTNGTPPGGNIVVTAGGATHVIDVQFEDAGTVASTLNGTSWSGVVARPGRSDSGAKLYGFNPANADEVEAVQTWGTVSTGGLGCYPDLRAAQAVFARTDPTTAESYDPVIEIPFLFVENQPLSTFSIDVDTASYTNVRRMLNQNVLPPHGAVRVEEMVNYFDYDYPPPSGADPFSVNVAVAECPWNPEHRLARIGIKGKVFADRNRPAANLVFLVDVSGSMQDANKLPLVRHGLRAMVEQLTPRDSVAIVTYADGSNVALPATSARNKQTILNAIDRLMANGSTNGGAGIETAYQLANEHYVEGGANRVILATDGDFNVGVTRQDQLISMIEEKAATGVFLSVLGFGMGNIKDSMLEKLADKGNGLYAYIDDNVEAERVLVDQMGGTLVTIAKDVKIQVEFNPAEVGAYRLIGYENRMLRAQDFNNDAKDAGEIGAGHTVTALYEIVPAGMQAHEPGVDPLKYQGSEPRTSAYASTPRDGEPGALARADVPADDTDMAEVDELEEGTEVVDADETETSEPRPQGSGRRVVDDGSEGQPESNGTAIADYRGELMTVKLRYKDPEGDVSKLIELPVKDDGLTIDDASDDFVFAASVASFGMMLRGSAHTPDLTFDAVLELARSAMGEDPFGYREEFIQLVEKAKALSTPNPQ